MADASDISQEVKIYLQVMILSSKTAIISLGNFLDERILILFTVGKSKFAL